MTEFGFSAEHETLRREVRHFAQRELAPGSRERMKDTQIPAETIKAIAARGYIGAAAPAKYGGQELDTVSVGIIVEELAKADIACSHVVMVPTQLCILLEQGTEEQRQRWIPPTIRGDSMPCLCITEPGYGSDAAAIEMRATRDGDHYVLRGEKTSVTRGMQADLLLVWAKTDPVAGARGASCFLVPADTPGISRYPFHDMGWTPLLRASVMFDDVPVPVENRVGEEGKGFYIIMDRFDVIRVLLSLEVLAQASLSLDEAISYAKQRTAFGQPIARFEGISFKIAEGLTLVEAARLLCYRALWMRDQGLKHTKESAMCKWFAPKVAVEVIHNSLLILGHVGYSEEYPLQQRLRDAVGFEMADGTAEVQKLVIVREVLGREFLPY